MKLEIGYNYGFEIRQKKRYYEGQDDFSILFLSDFHFNRYSQKMLARIIAVIQELRPTILLLGGDYVDGKAGLKYFERLLAAIPANTHSFAIIGNHDEFFGVDTIKNLLKNKEVILLEDDSHLLHYQSTKILLSVQQSTIKNNEAGFSILLMHKPTAILKQQNYNLAFAGHLHGGQFIFWQRKNKLFPGKLFYKWNILEQNKNQCLFLISKGLGDTLPIRYNCKRDVLFVTVLANKPKS